MVGMNPTNDKGEVVPIRAVHARRSAGITDYEADWVALQQTMDDRGFPRAGRLNVPVRDPDALPRIAEILHGLANDITALHAQTGLTDYTKLFETFHKVRSSEARLRELTK